MDREIVPFRCRFPLIWAETLRLVRRSIRANYARSMQLPRAASMAWLAAKGVFIAVQPYRVPTFYHAEIHAVSKHNNPARFRWLPTLSLAASEVRRRPATASSVDHFVLPDVSTSGTYHGTVLHAPSSHTRIPGFVLATGSCGHLDKNTGFRSGFSSSTASKLPSRIR